MKKIFVSISLSMLSLVMIAQTYDQKFGKVSMAEMEMKVCPIDSSAEAAFIFDIGKTRFEYNTEKERFQLKITRHARIKVYSKDGLDWANLNLKLYHNNLNDEKLTSFKGFTYNIVKGKVQKDKVEKDAIFRENIDDNRTAVKIAFPKVIEGSVLEFEYDITSDYTYNLQAWSFQYSIPVLYSQYSIGIPEYYHYNTYISGYEPISVKDEVFFKKIVFIGYEKPAVGMNAHTPFVGGNKSYRDEVEYKENSKTFVGNNIPALDDEAYIDNVENYLTKANFELKYTQFPGMVAKDYTTTWDAINKDLLEDLNFGKQLDKGTYLEDDLIAYLGSVEKLEEKIAKTYAFIKSRVKWNEKYTLYTKDGVRSAYKEGAGNSAEVNLNLIIALRRAGIDAYPIAVSTRSNGFVIDWQTTVSSFNHVVAGIKNGNVYSFVDATSLFDFNSLLPTQCLNGKARLIDLEKGCWVDLNPKKASKKIVYADLKIETNSSISGRVTASYKDYFALELAETIKRDDSLVHRKENLSKLFSNSTIDSLGIKLMGNGTTDIRESYDVKMDYSSQQTSYDILYLSPLNGFSYGKNPFVKTERKFPVNFTFPREESVTVKYVIPQTFRFEEIPENAVFSLPDGKGKFIMTYQIAGNDLLVTSKVTIASVLYLPGEYDFLRGFFDEIVKKQNERIILKRK